MRRQRVDFVNLTHEPSSIRYVASAVYFASDGLHPTGAAYAPCFERLKSATRLLSVLG